MDEKLAEEIEARITEEKRPSMIAGAMRLLGDTDHPYWQKGNEAARRRMLPLLERALAALRSPSPLDSKELDELDRLMKARDTAHEYCLSLGRADGDYHRPEHETAVEAFADADRKFLVAVINFYRANAAKLRGRE